MKRLCLYFAALTLLAILALPSRTWAQATSPSLARYGAQKGEDVATPAVRVAATIRTANGVPVPGATVRLTHLPTGRAWVTWTNEDGKFALPEMPAGRYRVDAQLLGFALASSEADFLADSSSEAELTLHIAPPEQKAAEAAAQPESGKASAEAAKNIAQAPPPAKETAVNSEPTKRHHHHKGEGAEAAPANSNPPNPPAANATQANSAPSDANAAGSKGHHGGFQQVNTKDQAPATEDTDTGQEPASPAEPNSLGAASSSDAFLMNGTVGRGSTAGGLATGASEASGVQSAAATDSNGQKGSRRHRSHKGQAQALTVQPEGFGQGIEDLYVAERVRRASSNRVRFGFYNKYNNSVWDARPYSLNAPNPAKLSHYDEQFGVHLGGPLSIPKIYSGRDRTFFFVSYELDRQRVPSDQFATVPTEPERRGDFSALAAQGIQLFDPQSSLTGTRTLLGNGSVIPPSRIDPSAQKFLQFIPLPNLPGPVENFHLQRLLPSSSDRVNIRVLHTFSPRLNFQSYYYLNSTRSDSTNFLPAFGSHDSVRGQSLVLGLTQNLTDRLIHDTRINWNRFRDQTLDHFAFGQNVAAQLGVTGVSTNPIDFGVPLVNFTNFDPMADPVPSLVRNQTFRFIDSLSYVRSRHTFRTGLEIRRIQHNSLTDPTPRGQFDFSGLMTSQLDAQGNPVPGTGFDFADFLLGLPASTSLRYGSPDTYFRNWGYIGYFQDDWRIHPRFTLDYGVRFEAVTPPIELFNHISNLDVNLGITQVATVVPDQIGPLSGQPMPRSLIRGHYDHWAPRLGLAWRPTDRIPAVVRAGYSIFYNESIYNQVSAELFDQPPFGITQARLTSAQQLLTLENGFTPGQLPSVRNSTAVDPNYRVGNAQVWTLSVETQFPGNWLMETTYTGTKGTHLDLLLAPNRPAPGSVLSQEQLRQINDAGGFVYDVSGASSIYHALQVRVQRHLAHGFLVRGLYTYGKSIDNASSIGGGAPVVVQDQNNFRADRGLSSFDIRHQFVGYYSYELPFGDHKRWLQSGWRSAALGNWRVSGITTLSTGTPFTARVLGAFGESAGAGLSSDTERADQVGNPDLPSGQRTALHWFNTSAFVVPPPGRFGNAARNTIPGPGTILFNFALARRVRFGSEQRYGMDLRWEVQNLMNNPGFSLLYTVVNSDTYGGVRGVRPMRTMDLVMRVHF